VQVNAHPFLAAYCTALRSTQHLSSHAPHVDLIGKSAGLPYSEDPSQRPDCKPRTKHTGMPLMRSLLTTGGPYAHTSARDLSNHQARKYSFSAGPVLRGDRRRLTAHTTDVPARATGYQTRCPRCVEISSGLGPKSLLKPPYFSNISLRYAMFRAKWGLCNWSSFGNQYRIQRVVPRRVVATKAESRSTAEGSVRRSRPTCCRAIWQSNSATTSAQQLRRRP